MSGNPLAREEAWRHLVQAMKGPDAPSHHKRGGYGRGGNRSLASSKDSILGVFRIGGGLKIGGADAISIASGLTSAGASSRTVASAASAKSAVSAKSSAVSAISGWSAGTSVASYGVKVSPGSALNISNDWANFGEGANLSWEVPASASPKEVKPTTEGSDFAFRPVAATPPNVPSASSVTSEGNVDLPVVSPLSLDSFTEENEDTPQTESRESDGFGDLVEESRRRNGRDIERGSGDEERGEEEGRRKDGENKNVFFDIGESFTNNNKHFWNDNEKTLLFHNLSPDKDALWNMTDDPVLTLADWSDGESPSQSTRSPTWEGERQEPDESEDRGNDWGSRRPSGSSTSGTSIFNEWGSWRPSGSNTSGTSIGEEGDAAGMMSWNGLAMRRRPQSQTPAVVAPSGANGDGLEMRRQPRELREEASTSVGSSTREESLSAQMSLRGEPPSIPKRPSSKPSARQQQQLQQQQIQNMSGRLEQRGAKTNAATGGWGDIAEGGKKPLAAGKTSSGNFSLICQSIDGEVMSFQEMEQRALALPSPQPRPQMKPREQGRMASPTLSVPSASGRSSKRRSRGNKDNNSTLMSLEDQIRSVLASQRGGQEEEVSEMEEALFGRGSPLFDHSTKANTSTIGKGHTQDVTVGSSASAQDILQELGLTPMNGSSSTPISREGAPALRRPSSEGAPNESARTRRPGAPMALKPSKRDLFSRLGRPHRRSASVSGPKMASMKKGGEGRSPGASSASATDSSIAASTVPKKGEVTENYVNEADGTGPIERYRKVIGRNQSNDNSLTTKLWASTTNPGKDKPAKVGETSPATNPIERYLKVIGRNQSNDTSLTTVLSATTLSPGTAASTRSDWGLEESERGHSPRSKRLNEDSLPVFFNGVADRSDTVSVEPVEKDSVSKIILADVSNEAVANLAKATSCTERRCREIDRSDSRVRSTRRLFPNTSPATPERLPAPRQQGIGTNPSQRDASNPFDRPPRLPGRELRGANPFDSPTNKNPFDSPPKTKLQQWTEPCVSVASSNDPFDGLLAPKLFDSLLRRDLHGRGESANPFDSPPRRSVQGGCEHPFEAHSSPIAVERSSDPFEEQSSPIPVERSSGDIALCEAGEVSLERPCSVDNSFATDAENSTPSNNHRDPPTPDDDGGSGSASPPRLAPRPLLAPPRHDTRLLPVRATPSLFRTLSKRGPAKNAKRRKNILEVRASIAKLKHDGVGGAGKPTSTLVRNEETGRYVIRDVVDDEHFDSIVKGEGDAGTAPGRGCSWAIDEEEGEGGGDEGGHDDVEEPRPTLDAYIAEQSPETPDESSSSLHAIAEAAPRSERNTPLGHLMENQIMMESIMDDDAVEDAVRAATECLSTTSSSTSATAVGVDDGAHSGAAAETGFAGFPVAQGRWGAAEAKDEDDGDGNEGLFAVRRPLPGSAEEDGGDFFAVRRPRRTPWDDPKWSASRPSSAAAAFDVDGFDIVPSKSMDDWGGGFDDDDSFAPGPQWDDDSCWGNDEEKVNEKGFVLPSPVSVIVSKTKLLGREG